MKQENNQWGGILYVLTGKKRMCDDLQLFSPLSECPLAVLELLSCLWTWLPGQNVLQLHIQLLLFLGGGTEGQKVQQIRVTDPDIFSLCDIELQCCPKS